MRTLTIVLYFTFISSSLPQTGGIKGNVSDGKSPIPLVNVIVINTIFGAGTDTSGNYLIKGILPGEYKIKFSAVGWVTKFVDVEIIGDRIYELDVVLTEKVIEVKAVEVTGSYMQDKRDTRTSLIDLNPRSAKTLPGAVEDVFRTLHSMPGVIAPNDFSSQLIIRGSSPHENLIIIDDIEIFNPYRLYGVVSMFNPDVVSEVNLITGGFQAKYGDRLSALLEVSNREGNSQRGIGGSLNASIVSANLILEGKNPLGIRGSWLFNSRRTYYDLILEPFVKTAGLVDNKTTFPNFYDFQAKLVIGPYSGHKILIDGIISRDGVDIVSGKRRNTPDSVGVYNVTRNDLVGIAYHYAPNRKLMNKLILSYYTSNGSTEFDSKLLDPSLNRGRFENSLPDTLAPYLLGLNFDALFSFSKYSIDNNLSFFAEDHRIEGGIGADFMETWFDFKVDLNPEVVAIFLANPQFQTVLSDIKSRRRYNRYRLYLQDNYKLTNNLFFQPSLRFDYYDILKKAYLAPRISMSFAIDDFTTFRTMWGVYYQSPGYEKIRDQNILYDLSEIYTNNLLAEKAIHYVASLERWLSSEWNIRLEAYYKDFSDLIVQNVVSGISFVTEKIPGKDPRYPSGWTSPSTVYSDSLTQIPINGSYGEAYGFEVFLAKKNILNNSRFSGWISYALAFANRYENNITLPFRFDQRHTINIVFNYRINRWFDLGVRWQYGSGFPYTEPIGIRPRVEFQDLDEDGIPETPLISTRTNTENENGEESVIYDVDLGGKRRNARIPDYHRLDVRLNAAADYWDLEWIFYLDVINIYNHFNIVNYEYYVTEDLTIGREPTTMFPVIPTLGFSVKF